MNSIEAPQFSRNYGFWNEDEQRAVMDARVAIAGVGGDGFQLGLKLAMMGVQTFDIADPEVFEPENTNRVPGATHATYGRKKADVFLEKVHDINPDADVRIYEDGVTEDNVEDFTSRATLLFDESELTYLHIGTSLARAARERGIPDVLIMNIGFAAQATAFKPEGRMTFERFMGIPKGMPLDEVKDMEVQFNRCLAYLPTYSDLRTLTAVQEGASLPSIAPGVDVASALGSSQAFLHMTQGINNRRPDPIWAPKIGHIDAYSLDSGITRFPRLSHYRHLGVAATKNLLGLHSTAAYTAEDRSRRATSE
jgi:molybdopterin/thiamine biosynthesis adenylyltransferase